MLDKRIIAINLPQFHPFKENDEWWGKGFTEWTNVTKAKPRFRGHYQPQLPTETGFYDLRLPEARQMQADMAREYGVYGFCYYHYWFNGHRLMEKPVEEILASKEPNFPFMLCWANENWARNWDGGFKNVLIEQKYSRDDDIAHMKYLCEKVFSDNRYITVDGKPFFVVYKPQLFPNLKDTIATWRKIADKYGYKLYLGFMHSGDLDRAKLISEVGFDVAIDFQPHQSAILGQDDKKWTDNFFYRLCQHFFKIKDNPCNRSFNYSRYSLYACKHMEKCYKEYPCLTPGWDNSARRVGKPFFMLKGNTPKLFGKWLKYVLKHFVPFSKEENFIFINAWNEWAEGNHLEPDNKWGNEFLQELKNALKDE